MKPLIIHGEDAVKFREELLHPDPEWIERISHIGEDITITQTEDGFIANIPDLDLSCFDNLEDE